ncbi:hypothetical protein C475_17758 [Halosimplex carlsbadense 2-9-1]|uniref:Uncharacterized protein n=2 Tax=Halosimplex carlsbadense TaxID=171164 RepID=M0CJ41_9EURY|nr:hypothetical protein C475_17758 [Halosimplex carlsbadense 2-9-1]
MARKLMVTGRPVSGMLSAVVLQLDVLTQPVGILGVLILLAAIILIGRFLLSMAWRLVIIGIIIVGTLYILSVLGFSVL